MEADVEPRARYVELELALRPAHEAGMNHGECALALREIVAGPFARIVESEGGTILTTHYGMGRWARPVVRAVILTAAAEGSLAGSWVRSGGGIESDVRVFDGTTTELAPLNLSFGRRGGRERRETATHEEQRPRVRAVRDLVFPNGDYALVTRYDGQTVRVTAVDTRTGRRIAPDGTSPTTLLRTIAEHDGEREPDEECESWKREERRGETGT